MASKTNRWPLEAEEVKESSESLTYCSVPSARSYVPRVTHPDWSTFEMVALWREPEAMTEYCAESTTFPMPYSTYARMVYLPGFVTFKCQVPMALLVPDVLTVA